MARLHSVRAFAAAAVLAAAGAALPSLDWCPLHEWSARNCEPAASCGVAPVAGKPARNCGLPPTGSWACDPVPDPLPVGDRVWCVQPPVTALAARVDPMPEPRLEPALAVLVAPLVLTPPMPRASECAAHGPGPPLPRAPRGPLQARAPPLG